MSSDDSSLRPLSDVSRSVGEGGGWSLCRLPTDQIDAFKAVIAAVGIDWHDCAFGLWCTNK
jgi:hypothetical protein